MRSRPGAITLMDLSFVTLAPNDQALGGDTRMFSGIHVPEIKSLRGAGLTFDAREEEGHRECHERDDGRDLKSALVARRQGSVG